MNVAAILPHLDQFGGVRRFLEIGNVFMQRGVDFTIFARRGTRCDWFDYQGKIQDWSRIAADYILVGDPPSFKILSRAKGKIFIYVIAGGRFLSMYQAAYGKYPFIINNRIFQKYFPKSFLIEGGVNVHHFIPKKSIPSTSNVQILFYDVVRGGKDTKYIRNSLQGISGIKLIGLRGLRNDKLVQAYHKGDFFVPWETREGWSNMAAEALSCGLTVVTNGNNCEPFKDKVIVVKDLRQFFSDPHNRKIRKPGSMKDFSWERVVDQLLKAFSHKHHHRRHK